MAHFRKEFHSRKKKNKKKRIFKKSVSDQLIRRRNKGVREEKKNAIIMRWTTNRDGGARTNGSQPENAKQLFRIRGGEIN